MATLESNLFILIYRFYSRTCFIGFLDSRGRIFSKLKYSVVRVNIFKTFPFFAENDSEVSGIALLCQKTVLV